MNSATDLVSPGAFGNSAGTAGAGEASTQPLVSANADAASEALNKSRRVMNQVLVSILFRKFNPSRRASMRLRNFDKFERRFPRPFS
jgi:hypothetical protein